MTWPAVSKSLLLLGCWACASTPPPSAPSNTESNTEDQDLRGTWHGSITQGVGSYQLVLKIERLDLGQSAGTSEYTGALNCAGVLTYQGIQSGVAVFDEAIQDGQRCQDGRMEVTFTPNGKLVWHWFRTGFAGQPVASTTLQRGSLTPDTPPTDSE